MDINTSETLTGSNQGTGHQQMTWCFKQWLWFCCVALMALTALAGCNRSDDVQDQNAILARVGDSVLTVAEFKQIMQSADVIPMGHDPDTAAQGTDLQLRLLDQVIEEMILSEHAKALGLQVSDAELDQAIANIKQDYPDNTFDEMLLENAVTFNFWRERLRTRLLMEKVVTVELEDKVKINPKDIETYYQRHVNEKPDNRGEDQIGAESRDPDAMLVKHLRKIKAEKAYHDWMVDLQRQYKTQIDWEVWKKRIEHTSGASP